MVNPFYLDGLLRERDLADKKKRFKFLKLKLITV